MNSERSKAYGRVLQTLEDVGPTKLLAGELECIRLAADTLLFATDLDSPGARDALGDVTSLLAGLVESGRWTQERANGLAEDLGDTGPLARV
jgi:hypothetical protein